MALRLQHNVDRQLDTRASLGWGETGWGSAGEGQGWRGGARPRLLRQNYTQEDMAGAIEAVHWGTSVMRAALQARVPRRTLGYQLLSCKKGHSGKCGGAYLRHPELRPKQ